MSREETREQLKAYLPDYVEKVTESVVIERLEQVF